MQTSLFSFNRLLPDSLLSIQDPGEALRVRILFILILLCIGPLIPVTLAALYVSLFDVLDLWTPTIAVATILISQSACFYYFLKSGNINISSIIYSSIIFVLVGTAAWFTGGWQSPVCIFLLALPVIACLVISRVAGLIFSACVLCLFLTFFTLDFTGIKASQFISEDYLYMARFGLWFTALFFIIGSLALFDLSTKDLAGIISYEKALLEKDLFYDELTDTYNKDTFLKEADAAQLEDQQFNKDIAIAFIKLNDIRDINQRFGYETGDCILRTLATKIKTNMSNQILLSRYQPDSFVILIRYINNHGEFISEINRLKQLLNESHKINDNLTLNCDCQTGVAITSNMGIPSEELVKTAKEYINTTDKALFRRIS